MAGPNVMVGDDISVLAGNLITNDLNGNLTVAGNLTVNGTLTASSDVSTNLTTSGNLTFTGLGKRILGDFSSIPPTRVAIQTNTTNGNTYLSTIPNGTAIASGFTCENNSTIGNNAYGLFNITNLRVGLGATIRGSGTALPLYLFAGTGSIVSLGIDVNNNVFAGGDLHAAAATNATDGFLFINSCAGTPVGTPAGFVGATGKTPLVIDSTNNKLYFYSNSAWHPSTIIPQSAASVVTVADLVALLISVGVLTA